MISPRAMSYPIRVTITIIAIFFFTIINETLIGTKIRFLGQRDGSQTDANEKLAEKYIVFITFCTHKKNQVLTFHENQL